VSGRRSIVDDSLGSLPKTNRTRRWGQGRHKRNDVVVQNRFSSVAPVWFYSLVKNFMDHKEDSRLWGDELGALLLSNFILALRNIVCNTGPAALGVDLLASDLFHFTWPFRNADVREVRFSCLIGVQTALQFLSKEELMKLSFGNGSSSFLVELRDMTETESDENCKQLIVALSETLQSMFEPRIEVLK
jgi:hypothetical protein